MDGKTTFADAYESAVDAGSENYALKRLKKFREWVALNDTEEDLLESNKTVRDKMSFELKEIEKRSKKLKEVLEKKRNQIQLTEATASARQVLSRRNISNSFVACVRFVTNFVTSAATSSYDTTDLPRLGPTFTSFLFNRSSDASKRSTHLDIRDPFCFFVSTQQEALSTGRAPRG